MIAAALALLGKAGISLPLAVIVAIFGALVAAVIARLLLSRSASARPLADEAA